MSDQVSQVQELKNAIAEFDAQYEKYKEQGVKSAGSRARKALMVAKKIINSLRKTILEEQKVAKANKKAATKVDTGEEKPEKKGKKGKKSTKE